MKNILSLLISLLIFSQSFSQLNIDSLYNIWQDESQADTTRLQAIHKIAREGYIYSHPDSSFYFAQLQYDFAKDKGMKKQMADALNIQGITFIIRGDYPKAIEYLQNSLVIFRDIKDQKGMSGALNNIGIIYQNQGNYPKALESFKKSLEIFRELGDQKGIGASLMGIGMIYDDQGNYTRAMEYFQNGLEIFRKIGDQTNVASFMNSIGNIYTIQGNYPKAMEYHQNSLKIRRKIKDLRGVGTSLNNIGRLYQDQGDYPKALEYFLESLEVERSINDQYGFANTMFNIGIIYLDQGEKQQALNFCKDGLRVAEEIGAVSLQKSTCQCLYDAYKALGNGSLALEFHEKMLVLNDSLQSLETAEKLQQMEFQKQMLADSLKKEEEKLKIQIAHETELRKKRQSRNLAYGTGIILFILAVSLYSRWRYVRKSRDEISKEKDRSENLLLNILPADIAEELKEKGRADARDFERISILFTDFKDFTQASTRLSAQELVSEINTCFAAFDDTMSKYGIEKIKTIGDAYMAAGGLPVPSDDSVKNTVKAAIEMQEFIAKRKAEMDSKGLPSFEMRVGIHTGPVVAGIVGVKKFQYDVWGDTVNTASRVESNGQVGRVNLSQSTFDLIKDDPGFTFESRGNIEVKGKGDMKMYFVEYAEKT